MVVAGLGDTGVLSAIHLSRHADVVGISSKPEMVSGQELGMRLTRPSAWERDYRVPFLVWGPGVTHGDLYDLNPTYADPGRRRILFDGPQPIRNGDVANLAASLLWLGPVAHSLWDADQSLNWHD